jgi:hypothetical protein
VDFQIAPIIIYSHFNKYIFNLNFFAVAGRFVVRIGRVRWKSHEARVENETARMIFLGKRKGYTVWGFIHRWEDNIKVYFKKTECEIVACQ